LRTTADLKKVVTAPVLGAIPIGGGSQTRARSTWGLPSWIEPGFLLIFAVGLAIGAGLGALVVGLL
jgi:hypothetical protein